MKYTYMLEPKKVEGELERLWNRYQNILDKENPSWDEVNEARAILYLTGDVYCEQIAVDAIERRLHLLKEKMTLIDFFDLIDKNSDKLEELRKDELFSKLEKLYLVVKNYKNRYIEGKHYLDEERFIEKYEKTNHDKKLKHCYKGSF
ncbi:MAG: hypothetical protein V1818_02885 [Candidatus Aenigmatarchaeota archaeon]